MPAKPVVLITGASAGIGAAIARDYAARGADLVLCARRVEQLGQIAEQCKKISPSCNVLVLRVDVTKIEDLKLATEASIRQFGKLDTVIANAGFGVTGRFEKLSIEDYRRQFETNVFGVLNTAYANLEELKKTKGRFAIIGSVNSFLSLPTGSPYCMSKFAIRAFAEAITGELKPYGVSVTLLCPGFVESEIHKVDNQGVFHANKIEEHPKWLEVPANKAAEEIVDAIEKRKRLRVITGHGKILVWLQRHMPWILYFILSFTYLNSKKIKSR